jgi:hypothetical protein
MKTKLLWLFLMFLSVSFNSFGQEGVPAEATLPSNQSSEISTSNDDKPSLLEHELKIVKKDSSQMKSYPALKHKADQNRPSSGKEEDALSFNFLYYIIQKFKISDLIDD